MNGSAVEATFERTFAVGAHASLEVNLEAGLVRVSVGEPNAIRIHGILRARRSIFGWGDPEEQLHWAAGNPPIEQDGSSVRVREPGRGMILLAEIAVPPETRVHAEADSGDIRVEGLSAPVVCQVDSGTIQVGNIDGGVRARSDSGSIEIRNIRGPVIAEADSGSIDALDIDGPVEVKADSGAISIRQTVAAPVRASADSGSIGLSLAAASGYNIRVHTDHGSVSLPELSFQRSRSRHEVEGQVLGGGPAVDLRTDSGNIDVR